MRGTGRSDLAEKRRLRLRKSSVVASVAAAILLALSVGVVAAAAQPEPPGSTLVLEQLLDGQTTCVSPDATCSVVNLYGQDGDPNPPPIQRGERRTTTVQLRNAGSITASGLDVAAAECQNQPLNGGTASADLCATVTVAVACATGGTTFSFGPQTLTRFGQDGTRTVDTDLAAGGSATCRFTVAYPDDAPPMAQTVRAVQPVTWTLVAPEAPPRPPSVTPPSGAPPSAAPPTPPRSGALALTGNDALPLALAGLALLVVGGVLFRLSCRRGRGDSGVSLTAA